VNDLFDLALKNILRTRTRTTLTVFGILIGITAIVALGSISEGINAMINEELEFLGGTITVTSKGASGFMFGLQGSRITQEEVDELKNFAGVKEVVPMSFVTGKIVPMKGPEYFIVGIDPENQDFFVGKGVDLDSGRELESEDEFSVLLGYKYAEKYDLEVGDFIRLKDEDFEVVGILEELKTEDDNAIVMPLDTMMSTFDLEDYSVLFIVPEDVGKIESLADEIEDEFDDLDAKTTTELASQASQVVNTIRFFTLGIAGISAVVGGLGVMNTMIMSIMERRREIGIMKAIGATNRFILTQVLLESMLITLIGGVLGVFFGSVGSYSLRFVSEGLARSMVTPQLILGSLCFALLLGLVGGLYPAWKAAKLDPKAIRYE
jgi:putative ABC transport system permease protein